MHAPVLLLSMLFCLAGFSNAPIAAEKEPIVVEGEARVIDAGTIQIDRNVIRLFGIVAPTPRQKCLRGSLPWLCGAAAKKHLQKLADRKQARCVAVETFNARCIVNRKDLSNEMVLSGWAVADEAGDAYRPAEQKARAGKRGLWESVPD
ncbi:thermonuclease family protein [Nisaea sp.]|uniref:thermonuclease family protein n=1 Tax=Nisaea sp. TaxID=2024842 RepID=UPI0032978A31